MQLPDHLMSEAVIQAEFYGACKGIGLNCALEVHTPAGRLDAALFNADWTELVAVVECKRTVILEITPQIARYKKLGVPVYGLHKLNSLPLARAIQQRHPRGLPWEVVMALPKILRRNPSIQRSLKNKS